MSAPVGTRAAIVGAVGAVAAYAVLRRLVVPESWSFGANLAMAGAMAVLAAVVGLSRVDLGLGPGTWRRGVALGAVAASVVTAVVALGLALPATRDLFDDDRLDVGAITMTWVVLVRIPLGTVLVEELAFRGVVQGLVRRRSGPAVAVAVTAVLFGLWHLPPLLGRTGDDATSAAVAVGTVVATTVAGAGFGWLRERSDSLLAPMLAHLATNSATFALAWAVLG